VLFLFYFILLLFCLVDENTKHFLILLRVCGKNVALTHIYMEKVHQTSMLVCE